jgi:RNA polymerase sigma-70 factor (ECF subfamily)
MVREDQTGGSTATHGREGFEDVMLEYESALLRYAGRLVRDESAAQDVVQETFIRLHKNWLNGKPPLDQVKGWLFRVTHNRAVDMIRRESRLKILHKKQAEERPADPVSSPASELAKEEKRALVLRFVDSLTEIERSVVILRLQEGLSYKEIGTVLERSEGSIGSTLHYAVKKLAARMKQEGVLEGEVS